MKTAILLSIFAIIVQTVSASYWTVRYRNEREQYNWYWAEYEYWTTNLDITVHEGKATQYVCGMSFGYETQDILFNSGSGYAGGCGGSPLVGPRGTSTELHALAVSNGPNVNCALIEVTQDYKSYICGSSIPPVNTNVDTPVVPTTTKATTTKSTTTKTTTVAATSTCASGYIGKRNGQGPTGACCSHSNDCLDTCVSGICGVHP